MFIRRDVDDESMDVDSGDGEVNGFELAGSMGMGMAQPPGQVLKNARLRKARPQVSEEEAEERPPKKTMLPNLKSTPNAKGKANGKEKTKTQGKEKKPNPKPDTYKQSWSVFEQHLLERLLEQILEEERFRWQKIPRAMNGTSTQVASRVQKYFVG